MSHRKEESVTSSQSDPRRSRKTAVRVYLFVALIALAGFGLSVLALEIQSAVRAFVAGESDWSKSQKEVVYWLDRAADTGDPLWLEQARAALEVPLADLRARQAMERQPQDTDAALRQFIAAGNHPADAARMVWMFRYFQSAPHIRDAIANWRKADPYILRLQTIIGEMEAQLDSPDLADSRRQIKSLREEVSRIAQELRPLQDGFTDELGKGSRLLESWLQVIAATAFGALAVAISLLFRWATRRIAGSERQFRDTFEQAAMGMAQMRPDGRLVAANRALGELLGYSRDELAGRYLAEFLHPDQASDSLESLFLAGETPQTQEFKLRTRDDTPVWCRFSLSRVEDTWHGRPHMILGVQDITEARDLMHNLHYQARHDALTGTINRYEFEKHLAAAIHQAHTKGMRHALCFIDLDQFKVVNDTAGHLAGDEVLQEVTRLLRRELRQSDILARLGGDEFGVILLDCNETAAVEVAQKLREAIEGYVFSSDDRQLRMGASIGCVCIDETMRDPTDLLRAADTACYMAKDYGRNRVVLYSPDDHALQSRRSEMEALAQIRAALTSNRFTLYAQRIKSLAGGEKLHCEILVRMLDLNGNTIPPGRFLPAAERYHIAPDIDRWVVGATLKALAEHPQRLEQLGSCHINLSGQSIGREDFLAFLELALDHSPVDPGKLCFEITETAAISNLADARHFFERLRQRGCTFALDDFGSGLSSFEYLTSLPVDFVKIDGVFVRDLLDNEVHRSIVKSIGEIDSLMGRSTVAECVETDAIRDCVAELGIHWVQGYGIHRPCPLDDLLFGLDQVPEQSAIPRPDSI
ncbi:PAS domain S-box-containing protein/diguanylate cyclase (GGDEF) domain-containing protein [Marinobacter daqiaonensis]|uniref:PAS domain S-box-containing protein/diguanylate cyclase (GGDEF) domain-containing protein n=1 Tax=Marinobacter daqiaonensis TaxID=650891 RepID=A0A1I6I3C6_9GAMM|nr:EAL domain-containing protein [Marinobacter daqiaonensis]SFR61191.1 PAS domain S-box-containing protein/diguanylate cyclase (GGDEF) domain-containing protein [Marinobacter daqiaonensis]